MENKIDIINTEIRKALVGIDVLTFGLAESVAIRDEDEVTFPAIILNNGACINVYAETDKHDVTLYHRLNAISYQENDNAAWGSMKGYTETADLSLLVFGKRSKISQYEMEKIAQQAIIQDNSNSISRSEINALQVFASEYMGVTYFMGTEYYIFRINYSITSIYNVRCINNNKQ
jgi:hypothetical protein